MALEELEGETKRERRDFTRLRWERKATLVLGKDQEKISKRFLFAYEP